MNTVKILFGLLLLCQTMAKANQVRAYLSSSYILKGESTELIIETTEKADRPPVIEESDSYRIRLNQAFATRNNLRQIVYQYRYRVMSFLLGEQTIPPIAISLAGNDYLTTSLRFSVVDVSDLQFETTQIGDKAVKYATQIYLPKREIYIGEAVPVEIKVYLPYNPRVLTVVERGLPEIKRDGLSAWRFHPNKRQRVTPFLLPDGQYMALTYRSSAYAMNDGTVSLGPGQVRPVVSTPVTQRGFSSWANVPVQLPLPQVATTAKALPTPKPERFNGAVGQLDVSASVTNLVRNSPSDPITVEITVSGAGNLDTLGVPLPVAEEKDWKLYPASKKERAAERRFLSGEIVFTQIMRPMSEQQAVPSFELVVFNPESKTYERKRTEPIPLLQNARANTANDLQKESRDISAQKGEEAESFGLPTSEPEALLPVVPSEAMSGFLGFVNPDRAQKSMTRPEMDWRWQIIPAVICLMLLFIILRDRFGHKFVTSASKKERKVQIKEIEGAHSSTEFYKKSSRFALNWLSPDDDLLSTLNQKRDEIAYKPEQPSEEISAIVRKSVLSELKKRTKHLSAFLIFSCLFVQNNDVQAQEILSEPSELRPLNPFEAEKQEQLPEYISRLVNDLGENQLTPDILYNIGVGYAKIERPGMAALYFHRALFQSPNHAEAKQNLRYLQRVYGSIVIERRGLSLVLSKIPYALILSQFYFNIWLIIIAVLMIVVIKRKSLRVLAAIGFAILLFVLPFTYLAKALYPDDGTFCPSTDFAIVTSDRTVKARTAAASSSDEVIMAPPGSVCRVLDRRGLWAYLEFANGTRGWLSTKHLSMLINESLVLAPLEPLDQEKELN